jgi:D-alanyl-lipoteichoic acid acyltransferase DltB (MBOAT superfamily)
LTARNLVLLTASAAFYAYADVRYLVLLAAVTAVAFFGAPAVAPSAGGARRLKLAGLVALVLTGLAFVKYWDFAASLVNDVADAFGRASIVPLFHLGAVVGVSFYTFQAVGYLVDVYRGEVEPEREILPFALFVGFFPQILAGPIGRAKPLLTQWKTLTPVTDACVSTGVFLLLSGALKKVLIGDFLGTRLVNPAFQYPMGAGFTGVALAVYGFAFQLYGDFAGYSEMAIGSARLFGIRLPQNFDAPYRSRNLTEFWSRWHISLSTWIRDYVFQPFAGKSPSRARALGSGVASMTLCGLWHGASLAWVAWGFLHGVGLAVHQLCLGALRKRFALKKRLAQSRVFAALSILLTFHFCCLGLFIVRAADPVLQGSSAAEAWARFRVMAAELTRLPRGEGLFFATAPVLVALALAALTHACPGSWKLAMARRFGAVPRFAQGAACAATALVLYVARPDLSPFIYTNF